MTEGTEQVLIGKEIGPYKVTALLGAGGMGEVYRAEDTRLGRTVAVKVLPGELAQDKERLHRFIREARAASALNHPHVAHIYEIGQSDGLHFIAMEYVEGQSLAQKISGQPLDLKEVLDIGIQTADALEEAHQNGITHRDIKPANVMLTPKGQVKVLDFGLAKITRPEGEAVGSDVSTAIHTTQGRVMGTLHYMSPEQVLGKELDGRTDLFSLGVVLYEMTTGRLPFSGAQVGEVTDRILHGQPEAVARFNYEVPAELERIIRKCLEKDRERRYQLAHEVRADLSKLKEESAANSSLTAGKSVASPQSAKKSWTWLGVFGLGLVALVAASMAWYFLRQQPVSSELPSPPIPLTSYPGTELSPNFSPDGSQVAFSWNGERQDNFDIYVKLVDRSDALHLTTHPAADTSPAWSPDGRQIAFVREGTIYLISPLGGGERKVADVQAVWIGWTENSKSLVVSSGKPFNRRLTLLSVDTGKMKELTGPFAEGFDLTPAVSPDGLNLVFVRYIASVSSDIYLMPLAGGEPRRLTRGQREINGLAWTGDGREVVYSSQGSLWRRSAEAINSTRLLNELTVSTQQGRYSLQFRGPIRYHILAWRTSVLSMIQTFG